MRPFQSSRQHTKLLLGRDKHELSHDHNKKTKDHNYEKSTTTTDLDPLSHTPIGATTTSGCVEGLQLHRDDEVDVNNIGIDDAYATAAIAIGISDLIIPVKLLDRFSASASSVPSASLDFRPGF
ncbi:hypothetical protein JVU11DRAFT_1913 [Chiua virens]|nr:hypothetical protein JVU11DRAFT_1913 [Chiua virens]